MEEKSEALKLYLLEFTEFTCSSDEWVDADAATCELKVFSNDSDLDDYVIGRLDAEFSSRDDEDDFRRSACTVTEMSEVDGYRISLVPTTNIDREVGREYRDEA